jgi:sigma-B regulation protein RsbU (phosphoserine phosphatase)
MAFSPVAGPGWSLGVVVSESEVLAPVRQATRDQALLAAGGLLALTVVVWLMVVGLTRPLKRVAAAARQISEGDLSSQVTDVRPGDEVGELAQAFNRMVGELNRYVAELTLTTKAKERIESELDLARQIQQSILPRSYPAFPDRPQFDLFALTMPAREVGGDFYDFFFLDDDHLGLVVGDVSGKGVPAALFMTVARTLIKNAGQHHHEPKRTIMEVNAQILPDNEMFMFVTVFYGVYELSTGLLRWVSAGHPSPLLRRADGKVEALPRLEGMAVGVDEGLDLEVGEIALGLEDSFLVYTDGLDEAVDAQDRPYGLDRAEGWLAGAPVGPAPGMLQGLIQSWRGFTGEVDQFDDLTLLLFRRKL